MKTEEIRRMAHALLAVQESQFQYVVPEEIDAHERTAFHGAAAGAAKAGKSHFSFKGKKYPVTMKKDVATKIADSVEHDEEEVVEEGKLPPALQAYMDKKKGKKSKGKEDEKDNGDDKENGDDEDEKEVKEVVTSADKKPENYVGPDGRTRTRMVPTTKKSAQTEANAPKGTHTPDNGSPMGQGLSPSAKKEVGNKTPTSQEIDEPTVDKLNFQKFKTMTKKSPMRPNDNAKGDTSIKPGGTPMKDPLQEGKYVGGPEHTWAQWLGGNNSKNANAIKAHLKAKGHDFKDHSNLPINKKNNRHIISNLSKEGHAELQKVKKKHGLPEYPYGTPGYKKEGHKGKADKADLPKDVEHDPKASYM